MKRAQLVAEAVAVLCPECGEPQPNQEGSELWTHEDFKNFMPPKRSPVSHRKEERRQVTTCTACDVKFFIFTDSKVMFQ